MILMELVVRGTEASLILLAEQFIKMGIKVDYCNSINHIKKLMVSIILIKKILIKILHIVR